MFLSLVFLAELVAGISGFVFRHEVGANVLSLLLAAPPWAGAAENFPGAWRMCGLLSSTAPAHLQGSADVQQKLVQLLKTSVIPNGGI